jgi:hypothetical protein
MRCLIVEDVEVNDSYNEDHDMPPVSDVDDVGGINSYKEWWTTTQITIFFPMDHLIGYK